MNVFASSAEEIAFRISVRRTPPLGAEQERATSSMESYGDWRDQRLRNGLSKHFNESSIKGKRVLDFGCGFGALSRLAAQMGAQDVVGIDINERSIEQALKTPQSGVRFQHEPDPTRISLPDNSVDVILSFWMLEHVMTYEASIREWARVLAPGGKVLILWMTWRHPYGHHLHTIVPIPWIHMLLGPASLYRVASRVYESPNFRPRWWHFDEAGLRRPNFYRGKTAYVDLNRLTTARFEQVARNAGLRVVRREAKLGASPVRKFFATIRPLQDFVAAYFVYELQKPE